MFTVQAFDLQLIDGIQLLSVPRGTLMFDVGIVPGRGIVLFGRVDTEQQLEERAYLLLAPDASLPDDSMSTFEPFRSVNAAGRWYHVFEIT